MHPDKKNFFGFFVTVLVTGILIVEGPVGVVGIVKIFLTLENIG